MIYLDHGHGWKGADQGYDPGAILGGAAVTNPEPHQTEAVLVRFLGAALEADLRRLGVEVVTVPALGRYADRHAWVASEAKAGGTKGLYVQVHGNAGGGRYALVEHDARSVVGMRAARIVAAELRARLPAEVSLGRIVGLKIGDRGHTCLSGLWPVAGVAGLILEPAFLDSEAHTALWSGAGVSSVATALAHGLQLALAPEPR